jgi:ankyrin repeat protein
MILCVQGLSFGQGASALHEAVNTYKKSLFHSRPVGGLAKDCHEILMKNHDGADGFMAMATDYYLLYSQLKEASDTDPKITDMRDFLRRLPSTLQPVVKESLDFFRRAAFSDSVEGQLRIAYDPNALSAEQLRVMTKLNGYLAQYHEGHLARADFALNASRLLDKGDTLMSLPVPLLGKLLKLNNDMQCFLEGEVQSPLIYQADTLNLTAQDVKGYSVANRFFLESPHPVALQQLTALLQQTGQTFDFNDQAVDSKDEDALTRFLIQGSVDVCRYALEHFDFRQVLTQETLRQMLKLGNLDVLEDWLTQPLPERYQALAIPELILSAKKLGNMSLSMAMFHDHDRFAKVLLDNNLALTSDNALKCLKMADVGPLIAKREAERADYLAAQQEWLAKQSENVDKTSVEGLSIKPFDEEKFATEHEQEFKVVERWQGVIQHIIESSNEKNREVLFNKAIENGYLAVAKALVTKSARDSANHSANDSTHDSASDNAEALSRQKKLMVLAAAKGDVETVNELLQENPSLISAQDASGLSLLSKAALAGQAEVVKVLIDKGAQVRTDASSPLVYAGLAGNAQICVQLMREGATLEDRSAANHHRPLTALMLSAVPTDEKQALINLLFNSSGDDVVYLEAERQVLVHEAIAALAKSATTTVADFEMLIKKFNVDLREVPMVADKSLALHALEAKNWALAKTLLEIPGIKPTEKTAEAAKMLDLILNEISGQERNRNCRGAAFDPQHLEAMIALFSEVIDQAPEAVNSRLQGGVTPLMLAAASKNVDAVRLLIKEKAILRLRDQEGLTALHYAARSGALANITLLLDKRVDITAKDSKGMTAMHHLAGQTITFDALQQLQGQQPLDTTDNNGNTVLHLAVTKIKNSQTIRSLLAEGLDPLQKNQVQDRVESALDIALRQALATAVDKDVAPGKGKTVHGQEFGNLAMVLQAVSSKALEQNRPLLNQLKEHKRAIWVAYKANLAHSYAIAPTAEARQVVAAEINRTLRGQDAVGRLFKSKLRLNEFRLDNKAMKELESFKKGLVDRSYVEPNQPAGPRNR